jgi:hypothetical protein
MAHRVRSGGSVEVLSVTDKCRGRIDDGDKLTVGFGTRCSTLLSPSRFRCGTSFRQTYKSELKENFATEGVPPDEHPLAFLAMFTGLNPLR